MAHQAGKNLWAPRFQIMLGLTLAGQIILGIFVYRIFEYSYARTEFALTAFLLVCGISVLSFLQGPVVRRIILGAGSFILLALLFLITAPGPQITGTTGQTSNALRQFITYTALILALLALLGKVAMDRAARRADMSYEQTNWFASLEHIALAAIAAIELLLQLSSGSQIQLLPFNNVVYAGLSLNNIAALLLGAIVVFSLVSITSTLTWLDGLMVLILAASCALFQYTFGATELARLIPTMSQALVSNINLGLSLVPLVLGVLAVLSERWRFITPLWLTIQLVILQPFITATLTGVSRTGASRAGSAAAGAARGAAGAARAGASRAGAGTGAAPGGIFQTTLFGQIVLYILAITLILLVIRLIFYWDRRRFNGTDGITVAIIALAVGITAWSLGQSDLQQAHAIFTARAADNLLPTAYSLIITAYVIGIVAIIALVLIGAYTFFSHSNLWLGRIENIVGVLVVLSITAGALLLLNSANGGTYIAATTLNPHSWSPVLPQVLLRNQYALDALFVVLLLVYAFALVKQHWNRTFAHTERALMILSGFSCLLALAGSGKVAILPLVTANLQRLGAYGQVVFTPQNVAAGCILIAALISLLWLYRARNTADRIVLATLFGAAALCTLIYYVSALSLPLLVALILLTAGTLIAGRIERVQTKAQTQNIAPNLNETAVNSTI